MRRATLIQLKQYEMAPSVAPWFDWDAESLWARRDWRVQVQEPTLEEAYMAFMAQSPHSLDAAQNNRTEETLTVEPS